MFARKQRPDRPLSPPIRTKAVAEGSSLAFVKQVVVARATRYHYGLEITELCAPDAPNPDGRRVLAHAEGSSYLDGVWGELIAKVRRPPPSSGRNGQKEWRWGS